MTHIDVFGMKVPVQPAFEIAVIPEPLACPKCGSFATWCPPVEGGRAVVCQRCDAHGPVVAETSDNMDTARRAVEAWNKRD